MGSERAMQRFQRQFANQLTEFLEWFVAQTILSATINIWYSPLGFLVNFAFLAFTAYGFIQEVRGVAGALESRRIMRFALAVFALLVDIWLNFTIH